MCGDGATCDAFHITAPRPDGSAGARAIQLALQEAGHQAGERVYINAHGTGTPMNDSLETQVVKLAPDPACDLNYVPNQAIHTEVDLVLSNSLGFGGHNACIAFRKVTR